MTDVIGRGTIELVGDARKLKASIEDAKKSIRSLGEGQRDISKSASASIDRYVGKLQQQSQTLGKSVREQELFKLALRGASNEQLNAANSALKLIERHKQLATLGAQTSAAFLAIGSAATIAASAFAALTIKNIDFADHLNDLSKSTSISVEDLAGLSLLAKQSGTDIDGLAKAVNKALVEMGKAPQDFRALGITAKDGVGVLKQFADIFNQLPDVAQRNALAQKVFGKSWQELAPVLSEGGQRIGEIVDRGKKLSGITKDMAARADEFNDKLAELKIASSALGAEFIPTLTRITEELLAAKDGANGFLDAISRFFSISGDQANDPARAISEIDQKLIKLRGTADQFAAMGGFKRLFSADDIAIVKEQIASLEKQRDVLSKLQAQGVPKPELKPADPKTQRDTSAKAAKFLLSAPGTAEQEAKARLAFDLGEIKKASDAQISTFANAERIMQAMRAANLVSDRDYYASKLGFITLNSQEQESALEKEIARMQQEKLLGKDKIDNDRKISDAQAQLAKVRADAVTNIKINSIEEEAANKKIAQSYVEATISAQAYIDTIKKQNEREIAGVGRGVKFRDEQAGISGIEDKLIAERRRLESERRLADPNDTQAQQKFDTYLKIAEDTYAKEIDLYVERTKRIRDAESDWVNGANEALQNYYDESRNVAKQTEDAFTHAFQGLEDALVQFTETGKISFKSLADSIVADITRMAVKQSITGPLAKWLIGAGGGTPGLEGPTKTGGNISDGGGILSTLASFFVGKFAEGTDFVPRTGLALVHQGERIVTAADNARGGGAGSTVNIQLSFAPGTDRRTVSQAATETGRRVQRELARNG